MNSATTMPDEARLRGLLDGTLSEAEQAEVLALVESNRDWQQALDRLAAGAQTWQAAAEHLHEPPLAVGAALRSAIAGVQMPTIGSDQRPVDGSARLDFLAPADDPRYLGRFGEYLVEKVIGRGGFGIVLQAFDPPLRRIVALKVLAPHLASNKAACLRFQREAKAAAAVVHDHVITIHAVGEAPLPHLVMQYVAGQSLQEKLDKSGPLTIMEVLRIGMQTAAGLAAAHKHGEVHRDIKPANILLENGVERVKITDFGLARAADDASMTQSGVVAGTPQYMSPEQARGDTVDARSDLFSLGSVLYAMCAGHPPFRATTTMGVLKRVCDDLPRPIREVNPDVPDWLAAIIDKLMAKRPEDRFSSAAEVSELLGQCLSHTQQPSAVPLPPVGPFCRTGPADSTDSKPQVPLGKRDLPDEALLDRARRAVREPAIGLVIAGIVNIISLAIALLFLSSFLAHGTFTEARWLIPIIAALGLSSGVMIVGGLKMMRLENRVLVTFAAVAALLISPGCLVGFAMGLWALVVLSRREVRRGFAIVARRHWPGVADAPAELPEEGEWSCRCLTCGYIAPLHKWGGVRLGAASRGKRSVLWCPSCRWLRWMSIERFSVKSLVPRKPPMSEGFSHPPSAASNGAGLVLLVLFLVFAIPLTLLFAAGAGYFFMSSGSPPAAAQRLGIPPESSGALIVQNPDSRLKVIIHRMKTPSGEHVVGATLGPDLVHNQYLTVPPGEYHAQVMSGEVPVRQDVFHVAEGGPPTTYAVASGGTLRIVSDAPGALLMTLNDLEQTNLTWTGAADKSFVIPEGLVHVDLRREDASGTYAILTDNYFDIVAGQETLLRVHEKDVELAPGGVAFDAIVAAQKSSLESVEAAYAGGRVTKDELVAAQLALARARLDWATKENRHAFEISIRQEIVALAEENERIVRIRRESGTLPESALHEAHVATLKEQEALQRTVAEMKKSGKLPADFELPPLKEEKAAPVDPAAQKAENRGE
jgi:serine/threonine protein kinase